MNRKNKLLYGALVAGMALSFVGSGDAQAAKAKKAANVSAGTITPALEATRVSGVAPLAVLFDASNTKSSFSDIDTFRQLTYTFTFDDPDSGDWANLGSKNTESGGPIAAHVFDKAGKYKVHVKVTDGSSTVSKAVVITVTSPGKYYAGTKTTCVSMDSDFTGCPDGAAHANTFPTGTGWNGKRILLHASQDFTALGDIGIQDGNTNVQLGSFGKGNKPIVTAVGVGTWRPETPVFPTDITVKGLDVTNSLNQSIGSRVLFYKNIVRGKNNPSLMMSVGDPSYWAIDDPWQHVPQSAFYNAREIFFVENVATGEGTQAQYGVFGAVSRGAFLGNTYGNQVFHSMRLIAADRTVVAHNVLKGISSAGIYHSLKLHSWGLEPYADTNLRTWASNKVVVTRNIIGDPADNNQWTAAICPQNDQVAEGVENVIVENNVFFRGKNTVTDLILGGRNLTYRNNVASTSSGDVPITFGTGHDAALPANWKGPYYNQ